MELTPFLKRLLFSLALTTPALFSQTFTCQVSSTPLQVRAEGKTELVGEVSLDCRAPNAVPVSLTTNLQVNLSSPVTNPVTADSKLRDVRLTVDQGQGPVASPVLASTAGTNSITFLGVTVSAPSGRIVFNISGIRVDVSNSSQPVVAFLSTNGTANLVLNNSTVTVAQPITGLFTSGTSIPIQCGRSVLPSLSFVDAITQGTAGFTARATEGFASAFAPREAGADWGTRLILRYTGFPGDAKLVVPDVISGSSAADPTVLGDFGGRVSPGAFTAGSLTLVRIFSTDANGSGGFPVVSTSGQDLPFGVLRDVPLSSGSGFAVYEVVQANPSLRENAQIPTFIDWRATTNTQSNIGMVTLSFAAQGDAGIPRFARTTGGPDCSANGDCNSGNFPQLFVDTNPVIVTARQGGGAQTRYVPVRNEGRGFLQWTARVVYQTGTDFIRLDTTQGSNNATIRADFLPEKVAAPGTYQATIIVDSGQGGNKVIPVTFLVQANANPTNPVVNSVSIAAVTSNGDLVPGALAQLKGDRLSGRAIQVKLDAMVARIIASTMNQINFEVPAALAGKDSSVLVVTVDGQDSSPVTVRLRPVQPAIFPGGVVNPQGTSNSESNPVQIGSTVRLLLTGIPPSMMDTITVRIHDWEGLRPVTAAAIPELPGVEYVDVVVPRGLPAITSETLVCVQALLGRVCSAPVKISMVDPPAVDGN